MIIQCKCKCGTEFEEFDKWGRKREYIQGHSRRGRHHSPEARQLISDANKGHIVSDITRQRQSDSHKGKPKSEEHKKNIGIGNKGRIVSDATRQLISIGNKEKIISDEHKQKIKESWIKRKQDPNYDPKIYGSPGEKNPMFGKTPSDTTRQRMSDAQTGHIISDTTRQKISKATSGENNPMYGHRGENHPAWKGGISKLPYCPIWTPWLKEEIKERDDFQCKNPDCNKEVTKTNQLCIHHIDYDKKNCSCNNLITLCNSCNSKANFNRDYWEEFYNNILMGIK